MRKLSTEEETEHLSLRVKKTTAIAFRESAKSQGRMLGKHLEKIFEEWLEITTGVDLSEIDSSAPLKIKSRAIKRPGEK